MAGEAYFDYEGFRVVVGIGKPMNSVNTLSVNDRIITVTHDNSEGYKYDFEASRQTGNNQICNAVKWDDGSIDVSLLMDTDNEHTQFSSSSITTLVRIAVEADGLSKGLEIKSLNVLNHFIRVYRYATRDTSVKEVDFMTGFKPFIVTGFKQYEQHHLIKDTDIRIRELFDDWEPDAQRFTSLQPRNLADHELPNFDRAKFTSNIAYDLTTGDFPSWRVTIMRAYEMANEQNNYSAAVLESFIALEQSLHNLLNVYRAKDHKLKKYESIHHVITEALPYLFSKEVDDLVKRLLRFKKIRNDVVHNAYKPTDVECSECLSIADEAFNFCDAKI
ncbi:MAG: hypothetical protein V7690_10320 [Shewanella sp.]|uniref:hypothetical protein n=1 Tax=Shewanella sp. TaxID=50422 RepID=UPI0030026CC9